MDTLRDHCEQQCKFGGARGSQNRPPIILEVAAARTLRRASTTLPPAAPAQNPSCPRRKGQLGVDYAIHAMSLPNPTGSRKGSNKPIWAMRGGSGCAASAWGAPPLGDHGCVAWVGVAKARNLGLPDPLSRSLVLVCALRLGVCAHHSPKNPPGYSNNNNPPKGMARCILPPTPLVPAGTHEG